MDRAVIRFKTFYFTLRAVLVSVDCSLLHVWASSVSKHFSDDLLAQHFPIYQLFWTAQIRVKEMKQRQHHNHPLDFCSWFSVRFCIVKSFTKVFVLVIESLDRSSEPLLWSPNTCSLLFHRNGNLISIRRCPFMLHISRMGQKVKSIIADMWRKFNNGYWFKIRPWLWLNYKLYGKGFAGCIICLNFM